jgi:hypothetical protein
MCVDFDICRQISSNLQTVMYVLNPDTSLGSVLRIPMVVLTIMNKRNGLRPTRQRLWLQLLRRHLALINFTELRNDEIPLDKFQWTEHHLSKSSRKIKVQGVVATRSVRSLTPVSFKSSNIDKRGQKWLLHCLGLRTGLGKRLSQICGLIERG